MNKHLPKVYSLDEFQRMNVKSYVNVILGGYLPILFLNS